MYDSSRSRHLRPEKKNNLYGQTLLCNANQVGLQITIHCVQKKNTRAWKRYEAV